MKSKIGNILFILILGSISTSLLLGIEAYTAPKIERFKELKFKGTILSAAGLNYTDDNIEKVFTSSIKKRNKNGFVYYVSPDNSYIFKFRGRGLWGIITGVVMLNPDLETVEVVRIISQEETPGLGARITEDDFLRQFKNKKAVPRLVLALRHKAEKDNEIDSVTGASITSQALLDIVNGAVKDFRRAAGEG